MHRRTRCPAVHRRAPGPPPARPPERDRHPTRAPGPGLLQAGRADSALVHRRNPPVPTRPRQRPVQLHRLPLPARRAGSPGGRAPDLATALERAKAAGLTHLNLDGSVIRTDRVAAPGPNGADLWWSGKHRHHGGNVQVISTPDGWPLWVSPVRPGREHDTTCARHHGLIDALNHLADQLGTLTLVDLGYENAGDGFRHRSRSPRAMNSPKPSRPSTRSSEASTGCARSHM